MPSSNKIPIIDLFAGPGGLGEGFSSFQGKDNISFEIKLSIEKDSGAHKTLRLRSFYRQFRDNDTPKEYYQYITGEISLEALIQKFPKEWAHASEEAWLCELGAEEYPNTLVDSRISTALNGAKEWVLIGGPPCQAYSLMGRSVMRKKDPDAFEKDHRHFLYRQYLRILKKFKPSIFIMENVKGLLSSKINDEFIFHSILKDLKLDGEYTIHSVSTPSDTVNELRPEDYVVRAENFGIPQNRHRIILLGVRNKSGFGKPNALQPKAAPTVYSLLNDLPRLTSSLSKNKGDKNLLEKVLKDGVGIIEDSDVSQEIKKISKAALAGRIPKSISELHSKNSREIMSWIKDRRLKAVLNHIPRTHMDSDIQRYFFAACYAAAVGISPKLKDFPKKLLPNHKNVHIDTKTFGDRFRVQVAGMTATTILSHIAKDGHYYIHPDPTQYRSFTVREAARLQTFPDNYFFEGQRTQQYSQVGNAVPPFLAVQIAGVVANLIRHRKKHRS